MTRAGYGYDFSNDELKAWHRYVIAAIHRPDAQGPIQRVWVFIKIALQKELDFGKITACRQLVCCPLGGFVFPLRQLSNA